MTMESNGTHKKRQFPSIHHTGIPFWFRNRGTDDHLENRATGTTTGVMFNYESCPDNNSHVKFPEKFSQRIQVRYKSGNPFSNHDNRNQLQGDGVYFWQGLGRHKIKENANLSNFDDIITWGKKTEHDLQPTNSLYREDFLGWRNLSGGNVPHHRRYGKLLPKPKSGRVPLSSTTTLWNPVNKMAEKNYFQTLADSQPIVKSTPWIYSYHAHSFSELPKFDRRRQRRLHKSSSC